MPEDAALVKQRNGTVARWVDGRGKTRTARVTVLQDGTSRLCFESPVWFARYRDADGRVVEVSTQCRDKAAAQCVLNEYTTREEKVRAGIMSSTEAAAMDYAHVPLSRHLDDHLASLRARGVHPNTIKGRRYYIETVFGACGFKRLSDLSRSAAERWLNGQADMGARTHNAHVGALSAFGNWSVREGRAMSNVFVRMVKWNEKADARRPRRAFTPDEITRLLDAAQRRPLAEALRITRGANLAPERRKRLEWVGFERSLIYKVLVGTGLRYGELRSIRVGQVALDGQPPQIVLRAADEKARRGAKIALQRSLAQELGEHLAQRLALLRASSKAVPMRLPEDMPLFDMPQKMTKVFDEDLRFAGIPKRDGGGHTVDLHALRHTYGTFLSKAGVPVQLIQKAMRHSDPRLTMGTYSHLELIDVAGAVESLPDFSDRPLALLLALPAVQSGAGLSSAGISGCSPMVGVVSRDHTASDTDDNSCERVAHDDKGKEWWAIADLNCGPLACQARTPLILKH